MGATIQSVTANELADYGYCCSDGKPWKTEADAILITDRNGFSQLYSDDPELPKYMSPSGSKPKAILPPDAIAITEGFFDAAASCYHGLVSVGAVAGVSHVPKALPKGCGLTTIFDSDGRRKPAVARDCIRSGVHLEGKILFVPDVKGYPNAGLEEYFTVAKKTGDDLERLIEEEALTPREFIFKVADECLDRCDDLTRVEFVRELSRVSVLCLNQDEREVLAQKLKTKSKYRIGRIRDLMQKAWLETEKAKQTKARIQAEIDKRCNGGCIPIVFDGKGNAALPKEGAASGAAAEKWSQILAYRADIQAFFMYERGWWREVHNRLIEGMVVYELEASGAKGEYSSSYVKGITSLLEARLNQDTWSEWKGLIPFQNGVLDVKSRQLLDHSPEHRLTYQLPYTYSKNATCEPISEWLLKTQFGDEQMVQLIRAFLKAVLLGRVDLQIFVTIGGRAGSGKSAFMELAIALVGEDNHVTSTLSSLENNKFETAQLRHTRLLCLPDADEYGGEVGTLRRITGQDPVRCERKNKDATKPFRAPCMVLMTANGPLRCKDERGAIARRMIHIPFYYMVPEEEKDASFPLKLKQHLPGLVNWLLEMPNEHMEAYLLRSKANVQSIKRFEMDALTETNPLAAWIDDNCVLDVNAITPVGAKERNSAETHLYPNYCRYMEEMGHRGHLSHVKFSKQLNSLLVEQLKLPTKKIKDSKGSQFQGLRLRLPSDTCELRPLTPPRPPDNSLSDGSATVYETVQSAVSDELGGCDGLKKSIRIERNSKVQPDSVEGFPNFSLTTQVCEKQSQLLDPSPEGDTTITQIVTEPSLRPSSPTSPPLQVGARVRYCGNRTSLPKVMEVHMVNSRGTQVSCLKPDGTITDYLPIEEVKPC